MRTRVDRIACKGNGDDEARQERRERQDELHGSLELNNQNGLQEERERITGRLAFGTEEKKRKKK